jgi:hypothetical protein
VTVDHSLCNAVSKVPLDPHTLQQLTSIELDAQTCACNGHFGMRSLLDMALPEPGSRGGTYEGAPLVGFGHGSRCPPDSPPAALRPPMGLRNAESTAASAPLALGLTVGTGDCSK